MTNQAIFLTLVRSARQKMDARLLIDSLRTFGGAWRDCPIWLYETAPEATPCQDLEGRGVRTIALETPATLRHYRFADKVYACAQAEANAPAGVQSLIWVDPEVLFVKAPQLLDLGATFDAAVRPVHIQNVGVLAGGPLDPYWQKIYATVGAGDTPTTVESFVDGRCLRAYFNSHSFAFNPAAGLMHRWLGCFGTLVNDQEFQASACADDAHQIFLFQALLSALLVTTLDPQRIQILPPTYNYPYNLHASVPDDRRAKALNDLVTLVYEGRDLNPDNINDVELDDPLKSWLAARQWPAPVSH